MKRLITLSLLLALGCGSSGGSSSLVSGRPSQNATPSGQLPLTFQLKPIGVNQSTPFANLLRCEVVNNDAVPHEFGGLVGQFFSANLSQALINYDFFVDGKRLLRATSVDSTATVIMPVSHTILPGERAFVYLLTNPHALHIDETLQFVVSKVFIDGKAHDEPLRPPEVVLNHGGFNPPFFNDIPLFIPWSNNPSNVTVWTELLLPTTTVEQELYDYDVGFRAGGRNQHTSLTMSGVARLQVSPSGLNQWRTVDELPIHGHAVTVHYKFCWFGEQLDQAKDVRVVADINCKSGEKFTFDRSLIGSDTGWLVFPTWHGPVFTCK